MTGAGVHLFFCFVVGFVWPAYLYQKKELNSHLLFGRWKLAHHRYSFARFVRRLDEKLNQKFNKKENPWVCSLLRVVVPGVFFFVLGLFLPGSLGWPVVVAGSVFFEIVAFFRHSKEKN